MIKQRTTSIELMRFIAAIGVMTIHFGSIYLGGDRLYAPFAYVFVEFFLILAGFFMMRHIDTREEPLPVFDYIGHKIKGFYAIFIVAFAAQFILFVMTNGVTGVGGYLHALFHFKWEALLLQCSGSIKDPAFNIDYLMGQDWYLSAMVLALVFIYPLARNYRKFYTSFLAPVTAILFYALIVQHYGTLDVGSEYLGVISMSIIRGMAGVSLGSLCYLGFEKMKQWQPEAGVLRGLSCLEIFCWIAALFLLSPFPYTTDEDVLIYVLLFSVVMILGFWNRTLLAGWLNSHGRRLLTWMGKLSLYLYLFHWTVMTAMNIWMPGLDAVLALPLYYGITLGVSVLGMLVDSRRKNAFPVILVVLVCLVVALLCAVH
ncbi:MAG: acyltransferase family protein [Eubacteriaceae bacterium]|nr:acyltransferase family protein [Eubacteriaceae bacterium]MDD4507951.1 acyltransferase family protein [Eubacteriaceae bacterium]